MNELTEYYNKKKIVSLAYDSEGCPVPIGEEKCGETKGFDIIMDFQKLYQDKISQIDVTAGGDRLQEKVDIQQDWINDLTEQNRLMARVIEELEIEAIDKVQSLEEKLQTCSKSLSEDEKRLLEKDEMIKELQESLTTKQLNSAADISKKAEEYKNLQEGSDEVKKNNITLNSTFESIENLLNACHGQRGNRAVYNTKSSNSNQNRESLIFQHPETNSNLSSFCNNCVLLNLIGEISNLKTHIKVKDDLLLQQLHIIKTLATKLYLVENCLRCLSVEKAGKAILEDLLKSFSENN